MSDVSSLVKTRDDVHKTLSLIDVVMGDLFKLDIDIFEKYRSFLMAMGVNREGGDISKNREVIKSKLLALKENLQKLTFVQVEVAFEPSPDFINKLFKWFSANGFSNFVLDIKTNPGILGGVILSYKGFYKDLSLATGLRSYFDALTPDKLNLLLSDA